MSEDTHDWHDMAERLVVTSGFIRDTGGYRPGVEGLINAVEIGLRTAYDTGQKEPAVVGGSQPPVPALHQVTLQMSLAEARAMFAVLFAVRNLVKARETKVVVTDEMSALELLDKALEKLQDAQPSGQ